MASAIILIITIPVVFIILLIANKNRIRPGAPSLILFGLALLFAASANLLFYRVGRSGESLLFSLGLLSLSIGYTAILTFVIQYIHYEGRITRLNIFLLALEPVVTQVLFWSNQGRLFTITEISSEGIRSLLIESPWLNVHTFYADCLMLTAFFLLLRDFNSRSLAYRHQVKFILIGIGMSVTLNHLFISSNVLSSQEWKLVPLLITGVLFCMGFFRAGILEIVPIARESVVENMADGWIVLDKDNRIVDINASAERIVGLTRKELSGKPAAQYLSNWPNVLNSLNDAHEMDIKGSVQRGDDWLYLNIHISTLNDSTNREFGKLIVWRDITARRLSEDARQRARDEVFILLHSITSAASRALNLDDFLSETILQIVYSSNSQSIAVYLFDEAERSTRQRKLILTAHHGLPISYESGMEVEPERMELFARVLAQKKPLLVPDVQFDIRLPAVVSEHEDMCLLVIPIQVDEIAFGVICLTKSGSPVYIADEITRLTTVTDEIASFIYSNRQRQLSIALAERQRLVRDLHDSVTQKLSELVVLAEATRSGIQAGKLDTPGQFIALMADSARQALKEMRLFMYQLQPVDFQRDGLATVLRDRLLAVEAHAGIDTNLHRDKDFSLEMEQEIAFYFIAQEALNNVLKHAGAKKVNVLLRQTKLSNILEIEDNGHGFDPGQPNSGGIGLRSMRERAAIIGGKLKISSSPEKGTRVIVTVKRNKKNEDGY